MDRIKGGARIAVVAPGSPAAKADLHAGDVVTQAGDNQVTAWLNLRGLR